jgi:hypothetical protein
MTVHNNVNIQFGELGLAERLGFIITILISNNVRQLRLPKPYIGSNCGQFRDRQARFICERHCHIFLYNEEITNRFPDNYFRCRTLFY